MAKALQKLPFRPEPIDRLREPFQEFAHDETSGGIVLFLRMVVALAWTNNFGQTVTAPAGAPAAVPEPSTFLLAIVGIIGLFCYRRRRRR